MWEQAIRGGEVEARLMFCVVGGRVADQFLEPAATYNDV
jgi:hypothetical protein